MTTADKQSSLVQEGWTGENKRDTVIEPLKPEEDRLHTSIGTKKAYEWWYFDAHLDSGHTIVFFFTPPIPILVSLDNLE